MRPPPRASVARRSSVSELSPQSGRWADASRPGGYALHGPDHRADYPAWMPTSLAFDPIERAAGLWAKQWPDEPADVYAAMRAVTSIMRAQQILIANSTGCSGRTA